MILELHDSETGNTLLGRIRNIDYDYQAEQWIRDTSEDHPKVVKWILLDEIGPRCVWERKAGDKGMPEITQRSSRFIGEWKNGPAEVPIPEPNPAVN